MKFQIVITKNQIKMESIDVSYLFGLMATPFGLATLGLIITAFVVDKSISKTVKIIASWGVGIVLSVVMWLLGKYAGFGAYALYEFNTFKDWFLFGIVALSPGMISNGIYDAKLLHWLLSLLGVSDNK